MNKWMQVIYINQPIDLDVHPQTNDLFPNPNLVSNWLGLGKDHFLFISMNPINGNNFLQLFRNVNSGYCFKLIAACFGCF